MIEAIEKAIVKLRRKRMSKMLFARHQGIVQRGAFAGLRLDGESNVSKGPLALKIFGLYESVVMETITEFAPFVDVVNIGAADGYFSLGLLKAGLAERVICFETTALGRSAVRRNAVANGLAERTLIEGEAGADICEKLAAAKFQAANSLMICDIEGAEFEVLSSGFLEALAGTTMIIELHDQIMANSDGYRDELIERLPGGYTHKLIRAGPAQWQGISDIEDLSDNDRALIMSEGRKMIGEWLVAAPNHKVPHRP